MRRFKGGLAEIKQARSVRKDYNPNEPRDDHGRWSAGLSTSTLATTLTNTPRMDQVSPALQHKLTVQAARLGLTEAQIKANMESVWNRMTPDEQAHNANWYSVAQKEAQDLAAASGLTPEQTAAVIAALSPLRNWNGPKGNKVAAEEIASTIGHDTPFQVDDQTAHDYNYDQNGALRHPDEPLVAAGTTLTPSTLTDTQLTGLAFDHLMNATGAASVQTAVELARGADIATTLSGPKVRNFYDNIAAPSNPDYITVDSWMYKMGAGQTPLALDPSHPTVTMTLGQWASTPASRDDESLRDYKRATYAVFMGAPQSKADNYDAGLYAMFSQAIKENADSHGMLPSQYQAAVWTHTVNLKQQGVDVVGTGHGGRRYGGTA